MLISVLMIGSTYSIFTTSDVDEELNVYETRNLDITYTVSSDNITISNSLPTTIEESIKITPYRVTVTNNGTVPYLFDVILDTTTATDQIDSQYIMTQVGKIEPKSLGACTDNIIKEDVILPAGESVVVDVRVWIADNVKNTEMGKSFYAKLKIDGLAVYDKNTLIDNSVLVADIPSNNLGNMADYIVGLYNDGSELKTVNIGGKSSNPSVNLNSKQGIMLDNNGEYRYYGSNPNNYVEFNGELWRIISVSNVKSSKNANNGSMRVKIIRDESIGSYSFDSSDSSINSGYGVNDWSQADLNTELNTLYYNGQSGTCYNGRNNETTSCDFTSTGLSDASKSLIGDALWYLGGFPSATSIKDANVSYTYERGTNVYDCSTDDGACPRSTSWVGKVGLMYLSDYMYATDLSVCTTVLNNSLDSGSDYSDVSCKDNNWLYESTFDQRTFSPLYISSYIVNRIDMLGNGVMSTTNGSTDTGVRPVVYLNQNVKIENGNGSKTSPYKLSSKRLVPEYTDGPMSDFIVSLYNDGSQLETVNIGGDSSNPSVNLNREQSIMLDNNGEYRYYGIDSDNYVEFNDELCRIISVSNVKSNEKDTTGEMRVKLIKSTPMTSIETGTENEITTFSWDSSASTINSGYGVNDWSIADLMVELDFLYFEKLNDYCFIGGSNKYKKCDFYTTGLSESSRNFVDNAYWYLGGSTSFNSTLYANVIYTYERGTKVYGCSTDDGACPRSTGWIGKVGLMYASDYAYATDFNLCFEAIGDYNDDDNCFVYNWLHSSNNEWTITPNRYSGYYALSVSSAGNLTLPYVNSARFVRPVLYLKSNVTVVSGIGTVNNPYKILCSH